MRKVMIVLAAASLAACDRKAENRPAAADARPAALTYDGADYKDQAAKVAHGERLTHVLGCTGCHGAHLEGEQFDPAMKQYGPIYASNLTLEIPQYSDAQLDGIIRHGTHPERKTVWVMPSELFQHLSDADQAALVAYLRSLKPSGLKLPPPQFSALDKKEIAEGQYKPAAQVVRDSRDELPVKLGPRYDQGRYITETTCAECHGRRLEGDKSGRPDAPPDLIVAGGYTRAEFDRLITAGVPTGRRKLNPMMAGAAKTRFAHLTLHERDALYAYLKARAGQPQ